MCQIAIRIIMVLWACDPSEVEITSERDGSDTKTRIDQRGGAIRSGRLRERNRSRDGSDTETRINQREGPFVPGRLREREICSVVREDELIISEILRASMKLSEEAAMVVQFPFHFRGGCLGILIVVFVVVVVVVVSSCKAGLGMWPVAKHGHMAMEDQNQ